MGMSTGGKAGAVQSAINVTPLIDVVLVLLIIFMVTLPMTMKMVSLEVPRKLDENVEIPDPDAAQPLTVTVKNDLSIVFNDGDKDTTIQTTDLARELHRILDKRRSEKVVFVAYEDAVHWGDCVQIMDTIRSLAADANHSEIKVALKLKEAPTTTP